MARRNRLDGPPSSVRCWSTTAGMPAACAIWRWSRRTTTGRGDRHREQPSDPASSRRHGRAAGRAKDPLRCGNRPCGTSTRRPATGGLARIAFHGGARLGEQTTATLVRCFDLIAAEDLAVKTMARFGQGHPRSPGGERRRQRAVNRAISAQGRSMLRRPLTDKAATCGVTVVAVNPAHRSQRCAAWAHSSPGDRKSQAVAGPVGIGPTRM